MIKKIKTYILLTLLLLCQSIMAQNKTPTNDSPSQTDLGIFALPPLERAVRCIKYYEGWHDIKRNYPYIGWGHRILPHEKFSKNHLSASRYSVALRPHQVMCYVPQVWQGLTTPCRTCLQCRPLQNIREQKISEEPSLAKD